MTILNYTREQVEALVSDGLMNKKSVKHFDVCKAIAEGKTQNQIAKELDYSETKTIRWIKQHKCPDCR
jgi:DNA-binding NarL/FixJ family response regulator